MCVGNMKCDGIVNNMHTINIDIVFYHHYIKSSPIRSILYYSIFVPTGRLLGKEFTSFYFLTTLSQLSPRSLDVPV